MLARFATLVIALFFAPFAPRLEAQEPARPSGIWLGLGLGSGAAQHGREGLAAVGQLVYQRDVHYASLRGALIADPFGTDADGMMDVGLLYGRVHSGKIGHAALAAGLSLISFENCEPASGDACVRVGVPVVAEAAFRPIPIIGVGLQGFVNLNREAVAGGAVIFMQIGWVR